MFARLNKLFHEFPGKFWVVVLASLIDGLGATLLFPFFALYITQKFHVGMTTAGILLGISSLFGLIGSVIGGALTDRFGRRKLVIFGLVFSATSTLSLGLADRLVDLYPLIVVIGLLSNIAGPAHNAMVADLLPEKQRSEGFAILRVVGNLAWIVGPSLGGLVASRSFFALFVIDSVLSCIVAVIVYKLVPETRPEAEPGEKPQTVWQTAGGYRTVLRDLAFMAFLLASMLMLVVYQQVYNSLSVFLRDNRGVNAQGYGFLLTCGGAVVVLFQFWLTRLTKRQPPFEMMALGAVFYAVGFAMIGFVSDYALIVLAIVITAVGEMIVEPTSQALVAGFAPPEMRGRYMAVYGLAWAIPATIGPGAAGYILDNFNPNLLWYLCSVLCAVAALAYYGLHLRLGKQARFSAGTKEKRPQAVPTA